MKNMSFAFYRQLRVLFNSLNIYLLIGTPILLALSVLGIFGYIGNIIYGKNVPEIYIASTGLIIVIILSTSGVVQILRREGPGPLGYPISGKWPMLTGYIIVLVCCACAIFFLFRIFILLNRG